MLELFNEAGLVVVSIGTENGMTSTQQFEPVIGLEIHAELCTHSKMFCSCPVVDSVTAPPNTAVCAVCAGMPGVLPVINEGAVDMAILVGLALSCTIQHESVFERKNYFYPDLPKGYQISQYQKPLAINGKVLIRLETGNRYVRVNRVHMEEDAGKLTHVHEEDGESYSLVDLNRAGVPLLEIVTEPDIFSLEEMDAYARELRAILRTLGVNSGDMEKGVIRFEANISMRPVGTDELGTRVEVKNLNSFRTMNRAVAYEIERQTTRLSKGKEVDQETRSFNPVTGRTEIMRSKEDAHDYRYFPEPDLPPLLVSEAWIERVRAALPELPAVHIERLMAEFGLTEDQAVRLMDNPQAVQLFEETCQQTSTAPEKAALWILDGVYNWLNQQECEGIPLTAQSFAEFLALLENGTINRGSANKVLAQMLETGKSPNAIVEEQGLAQVSDNAAIASVIEQVLNANPDEVQQYRRGKEELINWFFGQVMRETRGKANPSIVRKLLKKSLK